MMRLTILLLAVIVAFPLHAQEGGAPLRRRAVTADFKDIKAAVDGLLKKHAGEEVLVVIDIDNTLLAMNQDLGSDQWFGWQEELLKKGAPSPDLVARDFSGLLRAQGLLFAMSGMHPPEPHLPKIVAEMQKDVAMVVLTSRGPGFRDATERELEGNGYAFGKAGRTPRIEEVRGSFKPYDPGRPDAHGLSARVIAGLEKPRTVSYSHGIYMTAGQHKGYMLKTLLARRPPGARPFKAIVFIDDHSKHVVRMHEAYEHDSVDLITFHYTREAGHVEKFNRSLKRHVVKAWESLERWRETALVK